MKNLLELTILTLIIFSLNSKTANAQCHIDDWTALKAIYESTDGDNWINNTGWQEVTGIEPTNFCNLETLHGVTLDAQERVKQLLLSSNELSGNIAPELGNLTNLYSLDLSNNKLSGIIPPELGNLSNLLNLTLWRNQLSGSIPAELGNLSNLVGLSLWSNQLSGSIPAELGNLSNLYNLMLDKNKLIDSIPTELGNLSNLTWLWLHDNDLIGSIPPEFGKLSNLTFFSISDNNLIGCYSDNLAILCTQLNHSQFDGDAHINVGNNFNATWEDFCATGAGVCLLSDVYPGDLNHDGICNNADRSISYYHIGENGPYRTPGGIAWEAQACEDWGTLQNNGHDIKHHDCDGNGNINTQDVNAINLNYGKTHPLPLGIGVPQIPVYSNTDFQILLQPINQVANNNNTLTMNVVMDSKSGQNLEVFGGHFSIDYANIVANVNTAVMNFESQSWLGAPGINLLAESWHNINEHSIEVGFTKTNGLASTGKGVIGKAIFLLNTANLSRSNSCEDLLDVAITKIGSFNANQDSLQIEEAYRSVNLGTPCCEPFINIDKGTPFQNLYKSSGTITTNGYLPIGQNQQVEYRASHIRMNDGFRVRAGADFKVRSSGCN